MGSTGQRTVSREPAGRAAGNRDAGSVLRVVVLGYVVGFPLGGMTWHSLHYATGLAGLGHDVWFVEDSHDYASCYDPVAGTLGTDPSYGLTYAREVFDRVGLGDRWAYYHAHSDRWRGPASERTTAVCAEADVVINVAGIHPLRPWLRDIPVRIFVDADPVFTQVRHLRDESARRHARSHTHFFTFGESIGRPGCDVPEDGFPWQPTRQPIAIRTWPVADTPSTDRFTTVMQWDSYATSSWDGRSFGMKSASFDPFLHLPARTEASLELAVSRIPAEQQERLRTAGWVLSDPQEATWDPWVYQRFIAGSTGEFSVAKHGYVVSRSGWFSERSANYLASGRPVVVQDTGFSGHLPVGEGLLAFSEPEEALGGIEAVRSRPAAHARAARAIAEEHFAADRVLADLLERATR